MSHTRKGIIIKNAKQANTPGSSAYELYLDYEKAREATQKLFEQQGNESNPIEASILMQENQNENQAEHAHENSSWTERLNPYKYGIAGGIAAVVGGVTGLAAVGTVAVVNHAYGAIGNVISNAFVEDKSKDVTIENLEFPTATVFPKNYNVIAPNGPLTEDEFEKLNQAYQDIYLYIESKKWREKLKYLGIYGFNDKEVSDPKYMAAILMANKIKSILESSSVAHALFHLQHFSNVLDSFITNLTVLQTSSNDYWFKSLQLTILPIFQSFSKTAKQINAPEYDANEDIKKVSSTIEVLQSYSLLFENVNSSISKLSDFNGKNSKDEMLKHINHLNANFNDIVKCKLTNALSLAQLKKYIEAFYLNFIAFEEAKKTYLALALANFAHLDAHTRSSTMLFVNRYFEAWQKMTGLLAEIQAQADMIELRLPKQIEAQHSELENKNDNTMQVVVEHLGNEDELLRSMVESEIDQHDINSQEAKLLAQDIVKEKQDNGYWQQMVGYVRPLFGYGNNDEVKPVKLEDKSIIDDNHRQSKKRIKSQSLILQEDEDRFNANLKRCERNIKMRHNIQDQLNKSLINLKDCINRYKKNTSWSLFHGKDGVSRAVTIFSRFNEKVLAKLNDIKTLDTSKDIKWGAGLNIKALFDETIVEHSEILKGNYYADSLKTYLLAFSQSLNPKNEYGFDALLSGLQSNSWSMIRQLYEVNFNINSAGAEKQISIRHRF